jgi:single-strand selective monofunctional uracil DNA glycosylase
MIDDVVLRTQELRRDVEQLKFPESLYVYDPLVYAWQPHRMYLENYCSHPVPLFLLGMNPGPFGMAQTGVPFGEVTAVKEFLHITAPVGKPEKEHPKRPVDGFSCKRSEVSGRRLWGFLESYYHTAAVCFTHLVVMNYCPLVFMDGGPTGKNVTPDKLGKEMEGRLDAICLSYLKDCVSFYHPSLLVGIGQYAKKKLETVSDGVPVDSLIHPSPGNPQANKGWDIQAKTKFDGWKSQMEV